MHVELEQEDVLTLILIIVVLLWIQGKELVEDVMYRIGQNHHNTSTDMIRCSRINVSRHIVGNLMTCQVHINVLMVITK